MTDWGKLTREMERLLRLRSYQVAYKRLENAKDLENIRKVRRLDRFLVFCQLPALVREHDPKSALTLAYPESDFARDLGEKKKRG